MKDKDRDRLIVIAVFIALFAFFWAALRNSPGIGPAIQYLESGAWLPIDVPLPKFGDPAKIELSNPFGGTQPIIFGGSNGSGASKECCDHCVDSSGTPQVKKAPDWAAQYMQNLFNPPVSAQGSGVGFAYSGTPTQVFGIVI